MTKGAFKRLENAAQNQEKQQGDSDWRCRPEKYIHTYLNSHHFSIRVLSPPKLMIWRFLGKL